LGLHTGSRQRDTKAWELLVVRVLLPHLLPGGFLLLSSLLL
jgi:hypothetical protein